MITSIMAFAFLNLHNTPGMRSLHFYSSNLFFIFCIYSSSFSIVFHFCIRSMESIDSAGKYSPRPAYVFHRSFLGTEYFMGLSHLLSIHKSSFFIME